MERYSFTANVDNTSNRRGQKYLITKLQRTWPECRSFEQDTEWIEW